MVVTMQYRDLSAPPHRAHVASLRSQFMETEAFHTLLTEGLYETGSDSGDGYTQPGEGNTASLLAQSPHIAGCQAGGETVRRAKRKIRRFVDYTRGLGFTIIGFIDKSMSSKETYLKWVSRRIAELNSGF